MDSVASVYGTRRTISLRTDTLFALLRFKLKKHQILAYTPQKFNKEKWWLNDYFPIGKVTFHGRTVKLREGNLLFLPGFVFHLNPTFD